MTRALLTIIHQPRCRYRPGHDHTHHGARIHVHDVQRTTLGDLDTQDARLLGYRGAGALPAHKRAWIADHDHDWLARTERTDAQILRRYTDHWGDRDVWLVHYSPADAPRFMAHPIPGRSGDYVNTPSRSIDPDAACVDHAYQEQYAKQALLEGEKQRASFRRDLETERARRKATSPRGIQRTQRGRSWQDAA